jgi:hypothetical protein
MNGTIKRGEARADRARERAESLADVTDARLRDLDEATDENELAVTAAVAAKAIRVSLADVESVPPSKSKLKGTIGKVVLILTTLSGLLAAINELLK